METYMISLAEPTVQMFLAMRVEDLHLRMQSSLVSICHLKGGLLPYPPILHCTYRVHCNTYNTQSYTVDLISLFNTTTKFRNVLEIK